MVLLYNHNRDNPIGLRLFYLRDKKRQLVEFQEGAEVCNHERSKACISSVLGKSQQEAIHRPGKTRSCSFCFILPEMH